MQFADVIVDISIKNLDKTYQYKVPAGLMGQLMAGTPVWIPFGKGDRKIRGTVTEITDTPSFPVSKMKEIFGIIEDAVPVEQQLLSLAYWIRENYGCTMNEAIKTVMPVRSSVREKELMEIKVLSGDSELIRLRDEAKRKHFTARERLLSFLIENNERDYKRILSECKCSASVINKLKEDGIIEVEAKRLYRNPLNSLFSDFREEKSIKAPHLNEEQKKAVDTVLSDILAGEHGTYLLHGVTGSGKTEVYMEIISRVIDGGQVIMLIPEIALTYQTVRRFYERFGERVSFLHSRLSKGERSDQIELAKKGEIDIMIGPRSALFTPFSNLKLIIMDEEQEGSYKSESVPRYHAREAAIRRAAMCKIPLILGSATPTIDSYQKAVSGEYKLITLKERAMGQILPKVYIADLREELKKKNYSVFSQILKEKIRDRLAGGQQVMLFINRRGYAGMVSCRSCGTVVKCPHCDVSMSYHRSGTKTSDGILKCHYCGQELFMPKSCKVCGSPYIGTFGTGTQKLEELVKKEFPNARVLRMDMDTTKGKNGHQDILSKFSEGKADILVGTQMIVKGHDFPNVTLMGIMAADLSLFANNYRACEQTFDLLVQASGRAGRGREAGEVVIQTYQPDHYCIEAAVSGDYEAFYKQEMACRSICHYPPVCHILAVLFFSQEEEKAAAAANQIRQWIGHTENENGDGEYFNILGPIAAETRKINDVYRYVIYLKAERQDILISIKGMIEKNIENRFADVSIQFDYDPIYNY